MIRQLDEAYSYKVTEFQPIVSRQHRNYDDSNINANGEPTEATMTRIFPTAWTALHVGVTSAATWLLCNTDALGGVPSLFFH